MGGEGGDRVNISIYFHSNCGSGCRRIKVGSIGASYEQGKDGREGGWDGWKGGGLEERKHKKEKKLLL